ncbi:MAG: polysaccharide deacetylase family protein [Lachnospiraceae bacterium]|nr:polysaccharide deacetylase family protein [Lachnospiraceae bacterium]
MENKVLALSFDDGPNTTITPKILDILEEYHIAASFFLIGQNIKGEAVDVAKRALAMGCDICNHSFTHKAMTELTPEEIREEIEKTDALIQSITGDIPIFFRPPYINVDDYLYDHVDKVFICGAGCEDWVPEVPASARIEKTLQQAEDGMIFLFHDSEGNDATVETMKVIIPELLSRGFEFITVSEMFRRKNVPLDTKKHEIFTVL